MSDLNLEALTRQFAQIGAELRVVTHPEVPTWGNRAAFRANVETRGKTERFVFDVTPSALASIQVVDIDGPGRHVLLNVQELSDRPGVKADPQKLLLGHDEYHLFVAPVARSSININAAKQSLKPAVVQEAQRRLGVKTKRLHKRRQAAFVRQGEWFFLPAPDLEVDPQLVLRKEPIRRGAGKPHYCEELYRVGGTGVMVCSQHPNGVTTKQYEAILKAHPEAARWRWRSMTRDATAYARGKVSHPDHSTLHLQGWHRIVANTETGSRLNAFLD
jgi:hypothetical protein